MSSEKFNIYVEDSGLGLVYLLKRSNNSSIIKIGHTSRTAESRASNYTDGEWVVHNEYTMPIWLAKMTERAAHSKLEKFWLDPKLTGGSASEIFTCSIDDGDIAIQTAYIEQLEKSLQILGIPNDIAKIILKQKGLSSDLNTSVIEAHLKAISNEQKNIVEEYKIKFDILSKEMELEKEKFKFSLEIHAAELNALQEKNSKLDTEISRLENIINSSTEDFNHEIEALEKVADKKINMKDFESLRYSFRKAVDIIRALRLREYR